MKYTVWITITIRHTFFTQENAGLELKETEATALFLKRCSLLFRKQNPAQWILLKPETEIDRVNTSDLILKEANSPLEFHLIIKKPEFYYFTDWNIDSVFKISATEPKNIEVTLQSRQVRWEYILIPKYTDDTYPIELKETQDRLQFSPPEPITFPGGKKAYRSVSVSLIPMKETYNYKIGLWEKRENGKRLLNNQMPFPKVSSVSIIEPKEMITSYFYF